MSDAMTTPATIEEATKLAERYAALAGEQQLIEEKRARAIATANQLADKLALPVATEIAVIAAALEPWWKSAGAALTDGKRKSIELGGCMIGTVSGRESLGLKGPEKKLLAKLKAVRWRKPFIRITESIDKVAVRSALDSKRGDDLKKLGFFVKPAAETFFVERVAQEGTVG